MGHEALDLLVLKRLFDTVAEAEMAAAVSSAPTGAWTRRVWFLCEWLTGRRLPLNDARAGNYVDTLDRTAYFTGAPVNSPRHCVRDNLLGVPRLCPVIRRTPVLEAFIERDLARLADETAVGADKARARARGQFSAAGG